MLVNTLYENANYVTRVANLSDSDSLQDLVDLINSGGQLSWTLTIDRLMNKLGSNGVLIGLYHNDTPVGVIGIKKASISGITGGEIGYLYIDSEHRSLSNAIKLYDEAINNASKFSFLIATTITTNKQVNTLLKRSSKMDLILTAKSPFSSNILNYWLAHDSSGNYTFEELSDMIKEEYGDNELTESIDEAPAVSFNDTEQVGTFQKTIQAMANKNPIIDLNNPDSEIQIYFGRRAGLPSTPNTIYVGNKYHNKTQQYQAVNGKVPTISTFSSPDEIDGEFIAKKINGYKQDGQLINQMPENPDEYIFQPLLDIVKEYRIIVYYMNGKFHVAGMYEKTGSNMSFKSITSGNIFGGSQNLAVKACEILGYGLSGLDVAVVKRHSGVNESITGNIASGAGRLYGKLSNNNIKDDQQLVFIEANTYPSMANPMISRDILKHILQNKK